MLRFGNVIFAPVRSLTKTAKKVLGCNNAMIPTHASRFTRHSTTDRCKANIFTKAAYYNVPVNRSKKGNMTVICPMIGNHPFAECRGKCCYGDECNKGDLLDLEITGHDSSKGTGKTPVTSGSVQRTSVLGLFYGLLLAVVSINY